MTTYPSIAEPSTDAASLRTTVLQLKEAVEILTGQRGPQSTDDALLASVNQRILTAVGSAQSELNNRITAVASANEALARRLASMATGVWSGKEEEQRSTARFLETVTAQMTAASEQADRLAALDQIVNDPITGLEAVRSRLLASEGARAEEVADLSQRLAAVAAVAERAAANRAVSGVAHVSETVSATSANMRVHVSHIPAGSTLFAIASWEQVYLSTYGDISWHASLQINDQAVSTAGAQIVQSNNTLAGAAVSLMAPTNTVQFLFSCGPNVRIERRNLMVWALKA